jgi:hypothetical protein
MNLERFLDVPFPMPMHLIELKLKEPQMRWRSHVPEYLTASRTNATPIEAQRLWIYEQMDAKLRRADLIKPMTTVRFILTTDVLNMKSAIHGLRQIHQERITTASSNK